MQSKAFAKINLGLKILRKRDDGFHEIDTVFARIGLHDSLEFTLRNDSKIILVTEGARIPTQKNLVFRAAWLLQKSCPRLRSGITAKNIGVNIFLKKRIPLGAGLGGGSSDAAATLKTLNKMWGLKLPREKLQNLAASLGSDIPFFLETEIQRGRGRGELLENAELAKNFPKNVVVVVPPISISTSWAFSKIPNSKFPSFALRATVGEQNSNKFQISNSKKMKKNCKLQTANCELSNDFERIVFREFPEIQKIKNRLLREGAELASLSGSGSAVFGLFQKREDAQQAARKFEEFGKVVISKIHES
ncbi:MAG: 4-(cytidine 5'-diphospho)-2-C-methyl-D-erythritol kinase [Patescibacteria group bacterium]